MTLVTVFVVLLVHGMILFLAGMGLYRKKSTKEFILFVLFMFFSSYAGISKLADLPPPPIAKAEDLIFHPIGKWIERMLGGPFD